MYSKDGLNETVLLSALTKCLNVGTILCWIFSYQDLCREKTQIKLRIYNTDTGKHEKKHRIKSLEETEKMTRPDQISTFDHTAADGLVWWSCVISKSLRMRRLVRAFIVHKTPHDSFLTSRSILCFLNIKKFSTQVLMYSIQNTRIVDVHVLRLEIKNHFLDFN